MSKLAGFYMNENTLNDLRNRADFLIGHQSLQRGDNKRMWQLADISCRKLESHEGPTEAWAFIILQSQGKTNKHGKFEYATFMRHKDVNVCAVGALGMCQTSIVA